MFQNLLPIVIEDSQSKFEDGDEHELAKGSETILLVEDEELVKGIAYKVLCRQGYKVLHASNGGEAVVLAENHEGFINLLVTDVIMPIVNGKELAERLKKMRPDMKILYTSGYTADVIAHHGVLDEGMNFLGKPYSPFALAKAVRDVLDTK